MGGGEKNLSSKEEWLRVARELDKQLNINIKKEGGEKMNSKIEKLLEDYYKKYSDKKWESNEELNGILMDFDFVYEKIIGSHRWWDDNLCVFELGGIYIGFVDAKTTGDNSPYDVGWEFDPDTICEMEPVTETITTYKIKK